MRANNDFFWIQPFLTIVLIILIFFLIGNNGGTINSNDKTLRILNESVTFEEVVNNFLTKNYEVLTRGTLYTKSFNKKDNTSDYVLVSNEYDDFFFIEKGILKKINSKNEFFDISIFYDNSGSIVILDHLLKQYFYYSKTDEDSNNSDRKALDQLVSYFFNNELFPLKAFVDDFKGKKINPIKKSTNVFVTQWRHYVFTSNDVCDVVVSLESSNKTFKSMAITNTQPHSVLYFDFREVNNFSYEIYKIPEDYVRKI